LYVSKEQRFPLFCLLWITYFTANLGRLSYVTVMIEIINREGFSAAAAGLVGTGFFVCYGAGQIVSGYIGDRLPPLEVVFMGLFCTALANLAMGFSQTGAQMLVIWCLNGLVQSVLWPPILRIIVEYFPNPAREKVCVHISTTYPLATLFSYGACAGILLLLPWQGVFFICAAFLFGVSFLWRFAFGKIQRFRAAPAGKGESCREPEQPRETGAGKGPGGKNLPWAVLALLCGALVVQGALRDGLMTWIPVYTARAFSLQTSLAILSAGVLPLINLLGIYACQFLFRRIRDEVRTSFCLFCVSLLAVLALKCFGALHLSVSLSAFALITACMMGVNLMLVSFVPAHFSRLGMVSFLSGLANSMVYIGSSLSTYTIGLLADSFGWDTLFLILGALALASSLLCLLAAPGWSRFVRKI
jgi:OPA family glycerol-3-phosphate transporter-like MFS transporter